MSDTDVQRLAEHLNIENCRKNPSINLDDLVKLGIREADDPPFVRQGKSTLSGWPNEFTPDIVERFEAFMAKSYGEISLRYPQ